MLALLNFVGLLLMAMKYEKAAVNTLIEDFSIVLGFAVDIFYFRKEITLAKVIGSLLIVGACVQISLAKINS